MCLSPYFMQTTRGACVPPHLLQCRTCGSHAFHILDCCRNPDYVRVPTSPLGEKLKAWLGELQVAVRAWLFQPRQRPAEPPMSPEALDAWEARPLIISKSGDMPVLREAGTDGAVEVVDRETASAPR
jgi:hypothetical protein